MVRKAIVLAPDQVALLPLANRPLAAHVLDSLAEAGISEAAVVGAADIHEQLQTQLGDLRERCTVHVTERSPDGGLPALLGGLADFVDDEPFLLHLGDSLSRNSLRSILQAKPSRLDTTVLVEEVIDSRAVVELTPRQPSVGAKATLDHGAPAGAWVLGGGAPDVAKDLPASGGWELEISRITQHLVSRGGHIEQRRVTGWWRYRQRPGALLEGNRFALEAMPSRQVDAELIDTRIEGVVSIDPSARLESTIVRGPAIIGARAQLHDAYIGPYTSIGDDVVIEGAEVEHSIILPGASIRHLAGRLEASIVGPRARVFRDFRLPRALRLTVGEGAEISLA